MRGIREFLSSVVCLAVFSGMAMADVHASRTLRVGTVLAAADLKVGSEGDKEELAKYVGRETKRSIYVGRTILPEDVGPVTIIRRNDVVSLTFASALLGLRTEARALSSGGIGETISVMNTDTRVTVRATIVGHKKVEVRR